MQVMRDVAVEVGEVLLALLIALVRIVVPVLEFAVFIVVSLFVIGLCRMMLF